MTCKKPGLILMSVLFVSAFATAVAQCNGAQTVIYGGVWALRQNADTVYTYSDAYPTGPDAPWDSVQVSQTDTLNNTHIGTWIGTANPGQEAWNKIYTSVDYWGFGDYQATATITAYDACTGLHMPPFSNGASGIVSADVWVHQPNITGASRLGVKNFSPGLPNYTVLTASTGGAPETPYWFVESGNTSQVTFPNSGQAITVSPAAGIPPGCSGTFIQFRVGNLKSTIIGVYPVGLKQTFTSQTNAAWNYTERVGNPPRVVPYSGYMSQINWSVTDTCGSGIDETQLHEEFPQGFSYVYSGSNWPLPTADQWCSTGTWTDYVGEACECRQGLNSCISTCTPATLNPQNPLNTAQIYKGAQNIWVGYLSSSTNSCVNSPTFLGSPSYDSNDEMIWSGTQIHFQDHGGFTQP